MGDDSPQPARTEEQTAKLKQNLTDFKNALPLYLQGYARFLNKVARFFTGKPEARVVITYDPLPDAEARSDAALLSVIVERNFQRLIESYPKILVIGMFIKHTFFRANIKIIDPDTMRRAEEIETPEQKAAREKKAAEAAANQT